MKIKKKKQSEERAEGEPLTSTEKVYNGLILTANLMSYKFP